MSAISDSSELLELLVARYNRRQVESWSRYVAYIRSESIRDEGDIKASEENIARLIKSDPPPEIVLSKEHCPACLKIKADLVHYGSARLCAECIDLFIERLPEIKDSQVKPRSTDETDRCYLCLHSLNEVKKAGSSRLVVLCSDCIAGLVDK